METYCPNLTHCYGCYKPLQNGDQIVSYFEHYMHAACAPVFILECSRVWSYREGKWCDECQAFMIYNLEKKLFEHVSTGRITC